MQVAKESFDRGVSGAAIVLLAADATSRFDGGTGRRKRRNGRSNPVGTEKSRIVQRSGSRDPNLIPERQPAYASPVAFEGQAGNSSPVEISLGVLFENSIVCHVFYAIWSWGLRMVGFCLLCVVFGACFVLVCLALWIFVFGGLGWAWSGFLDCVLTFFGVLAGCFGWLGFCLFSLESLILAQDERWRRA